MADSAWTSLLPEEIIELASRYVTVDNVNFPKPGDFFAMFIRPIPNNKVLKNNEKWHFIGYGLCRSYLLDELEKPRGKWIYFTYADLTQFPLKEQRYQLQPPHIVLGKFSLPGRGHEIKFEKCMLQPRDGEPKQKSKNASFSPQNSKHSGKLLQFPKSPDT